MNDIQRPRHLTQSDEHATVETLPPANSASMAELIHEPRRITGTLLLLTQLFLWFTILFSAISSVTADITYTPSSHDDAPRILQPTVAPTIPAPQKAYDLLKRLEERQGTPLPGYVGGRDFQNRERRLPWGRYREYDVNPKLRGRGRDAERLVIEQRTGKAYYTEDHYRTFVPLN